MDLSTSLHAAVLRSMENVMDGIAMDGLAALKSTLDQAKLSDKMEYEIFSHISGDSVIFEIVVDSSKVVASDAKTLAAMNSERQELAKQIAKTFEIGEAGPRRVIDKRVPIASATRSAKDARSQETDARNSARRKAGTISSTLVNPRGLELENGKLSVTLERSTRVDKSGNIIFPKGEFQGLLGDFMGRLRTAVSENFAKDLQKILARHIK